MSGYPLHPAVVAGHRAALASIAERRAHLDAITKQRADAIRFAPSPTGINVKPPAPGANPWLAESWNMSQQALLANRDPATAARLRSEAGLDGLHVPTREDAHRVQSSGIFVAQRVADAVKQKPEPEAPAPAPQAAPERERDSTNASPQALAWTREALRNIGATVRPSLFVMLAESIDKGARLDAEGRVEMFAEDGSVLVDLKGTAAAGRIVGYSPEAYLRHVWDIEPDAPVEPPSAPAEPEEPKPAPFVPMHIRAAQAYAAGPEAVAALLAERYGSPR